MNDSTNDNALVDGKLHTKLSCTHKDGHAFPCEAVISPIAMNENGGHAIVLSPISDDSEEAVVDEIAMSIAQNGQRIGIIEKSLNSLLAIANNDPALLSGLANHEQADTPIAVSTNDKIELREQVVRLMLSALACWEHDLNRNKLDLAEQSTIWPVYMDKSTPTTRTLDKYLHIDSCPKNPRVQRVIDTAEFVLRETKKNLTSHRQNLDDDLAVFRAVLSGV